MTASNELGGKIYQHSKKMPRSLIPQSARLLDAGRK